MKRTVAVLICSMIFSLYQSLAQEYTAAKYWSFEHDSIYLSLSERHKAGDTLSPEEQKTLSDYKAMLNDYFEKMSDNEKSLYYKYRAKWAGAPPVPTAPSRTQETDVFAGERSMYSQYLVSNGIFGALYGGAAVAVLGIGEEGGGAAAGIPLLTAGASVLIPVLTMKDKNVTYNSLALSIHGKLAGALQGAALGVAIVGDNVEDGKFILATSTLSSIALGRIGFSLGKTKPWSRGRAALYSYYGILMPLEGLALDAAFGFEDPRIYGLTSLAFGAGGYLIADRVANSYDYTRGDVTATGTLATINGLLGLMILTDIENASDEAGTANILIPAAGALAGTFIGHSWLKNARLTDQQGRNVALASVGGAAIGLGLTAIFSPESATPYYVASYITAMTSYAIMLERYKKTNISTSFLDSHKSGWNFNFMPQNIFLNRMIAEKAFANPGKRIDLLPAFSTTFTF